jgi:hypothetical protein
LLANGPVVDAIWRRLLESAAPRRPVPLTDEADLRLIADGVRVDAVSRDAARYVFRLPSRPTTMRIRSRSVVPQELGIARDPRSLGVALRRMMLGSREQTRVAHADDARPIDGFYDHEPGNGFRWTDGDAAIPAILLAGLAGPLLCTLEIGATAQYLDEGRTLRVA